MIYRMKCKVNHDILGEKYLTYNQMNIINAFLKAWLENEFWMEKYLNAVVYDTSNVSAVKNQITYLPDKSYNMISMFYGTEIADTIRRLTFNLMKAHMEVIEFMNYADNEFAASKIIEFYKAADSIAEYLPKINSYWQEEHWKQLFYQYIRFKTDEIRATINNSYVERIDLYEKINDVIFLISDYMAKGIIESNIRIPEK